MHFKTDPYRATFIGMITVVICLFIYMVAFVAPVFLIFPIMFNLSFLPFNYLGEWVFGKNNYFMIESTVLVCELLLFFILCVIYFRKLIQAERRGEKFSTNRLIVFFVFLQFTVHPIVFFYWLIVAYRGEHEDPMTFLYCIETFPYSASSFIIFGIVIDLVRFRISKKNSN